jgi:hypothetical protein
LNFIVLITPPFPFGLGGFLCLVNLFYGIPKGIDRW